MRRVMFFCQNFLGLGHLARTAAILEQLDGRAETCLVFGGQRPPSWPIPRSTRTVELPALRRHEGKLLVVDDDRSLKTVKAVRARLIAEVFDRFAPDVLVIEGFPFSKRALAFELVPLLTRAHARRPRPQVLCSLRDIVMAKPYSPKKRARKETGTIAWANRFFDGVLVHADPRVFRLDERFERMHALRSPMHYTGYVVQPAPRPDDPDPDLDPGRPTILVSVGGGRLGHDLLDGITRAAPLLGDRIDHRILTYTGPFAPDDLYAELCRRADGQPQLHIRRFTTDFIGHMKAADLSISLFGYNTAMNVLSTGVRALTLPSDKDLEQPLRARSFAQKGLVGLLEPADLKPRRLAERIISALATTHRAPAIDFDLDGAARAADVILHAGRMPAAAPRRSRI